MMFGNIILSGFQMIAEAGFTQRNITIAALSLTIGIGFTQVSDIFTQFPALFQQIFASNCIAVAFVDGRDPERRAAQRGALPLCAQGGTGRGRRVITTRHISCA